ncbi:hypothetical protein LJC40_08030 [Synergistaceae bacterium OttesenSCG-928-D05]|nr:hypothetical protein [Synergistaceae bacterium OttesenSCG-928-D05]
MEPNGYLPFQTAPQAGDKLVLFPVYVYPVEILERGLMTRPSYKYYVALVNGFNKKAELLELQKIVPDENFDASGFECKRLELKIDAQFAETLAEYGAVPEDFRSWRQVVRSRKVSIRSEKMRLLWHVYIVRGAEIVDSYTGVSLPAAGMVDMLFSGEKGADSENF